MPVGGGAGDRVSDYAMTEPLAQNDAGLHAASSATEPRARSTARRFPGSHEEARSTPKSDLLEWKRCRPKTR